jgi:hypothetical protein
MRAGVRVGEEDREENGFSVTTTPIVSKLLLESVIGICGAEPSTVKILMAF